jgi:hypothetical protein
VRIDIFEYVAVNTADAALTMGRIGEVVRTHDILVTHHTGVSISQNRLQSPHQHYGCDGKQHKLPANPSLHAQYSFILCMQLRIDTATMQRLPTMTWRQDIPDPDSTVYVFFIQTA